LGNFGVTRLDDMKQETWQKAKFDASILEQALVPRPGVQTVKVISKYIPEAVSYDVTEETRKLSG